LSGSGSSTFAVRNGLTVDGTVLVGDTVGAAYYGIISFATSQTVGGHGSIVFGNHGSDTLQALGTGLTITLGPDLTVRGKHGTISGSNQNSSVTHYILQGAVLAEVAGGAIEVGRFATTLTNSGRLEARNGASLTVRPDTWTNSGTTSVTGGGTLTIAAN